MINYAFFMPEEMAERTAADDPSVANVLKGPKVMLIGTD
ncbi:hypothetical protein J2129_000342 [Methanofollis sp. W23]|nr:hypothetical protein [Methanofollis sp. W23]